MKKKNITEKKKINLFSYDFNKFSEVEKTLLKDNNINCFEYPSKSKKELISNLKRVKKKANINIILSKLGINFDESIYKYLSKPKIFLSYTTGLNHLSLTKKMKDMMIISLENTDFDLKNIPSTAELTMGLILNLIKNINSAINDTKNLYWRREKYLGKQLKDLTIGIIGCGRIGSKVAKYCKIFGAKVLKYDLVKYKSNTNLKNLLKKSDVVTLHVKHKKKNNFYFDKSKFKLMKKNSYFINTSRGELINEKDLLEVLKKRKIVGAALDVLINDSLSNEKITNQGMLKICKFAMNNSNLIVTPHIGGATYGALRAARRIILKKLILFLKNSKLI